MACDGMSRPDNGLLPARTQCIVSAKDGADVRDVVTGAQDPHGSNTPAQGGARWLAATVSSWSMRDAGFGDTSQAPRNSDPPVATITFG
jgi:hypothetical protein